MNDASFDAALDRRAGRTATRWQEPTRRVVFDPTVPATARAVLAARTDRLVAAGLPNHARRPVWLPPRRRLGEEVVVGVLVLAMGLVAATQNLVYGATHPGGGWASSAGVLAGGSAAAVVVYLVAWAALVMVRQTLPADRAAAAYRGRYVLPDQDLDAASRDLLERASVPLARLRDAAAGRSGAVDRRRAVAEIDWLEWDLTDQLRELTVRRADRAMSETLAPVEREVTTRMAALDQLAAEVDRRFG